MAGGQNKVGNLNMIDIHPKLPAWFGEDPGLLQIWSGVLTSHHHRKPTMPRHINAERPCQKLPSTTNQMAPEMNVLKCAICNHGSNQPNLLN